MKILVLAPHSELWVHAFPEALVAEALKQSGHEIVYVGCGRRLEAFCVAMAAKGLSPSSPVHERQLVCERCERNERVIRSQFEFSGPTLSGITEPGDDREIDRLMSINDGAAALELECDGIPLGRIALYEFMLRNKRMDLEFNDADWSDYQVGLRNVIGMSLIGQRLLDRVKPDVMIVYNSLYSVLNVVCRQARQRGVRQYFLHAGGNLSNRLQTLMMGLGDTVDYQYQVVDEWPRFAHVPASRGILANVTDHVLQLLAGRNVFAYSKASGGVSAGVRQRYGVPRNAKLLVVALSSNDELTALNVVGAMPEREPPLFTSQVEWVKHLIAYATQRADRFLLIRVHPREFPNRRESQLSQHAAKLKAVLTDLPSNVRVNWPSDDISLYDLADETDVFLTAWSSVGREMPLLGIPVVSYAPGILFYGRELNYTATSVAEYNDMIERALADGWSFERARVAYRWTSFEFTHSLLDISNSYKQLENEDFSKRPLTRRFVDGVGRRVDPAYQQNSDCRRRVPRLEAADMINRIVETGARSILDLIDPSRIEQATLEEETTALRRELSRLANVLYPTAEARAASRLWTKLSSPG